MEICFAPHGEAAQLCTGTIRETWLMESSGHSLTVHPMHISSTVNPALLRLDNVPNVPAGLQTCSHLLHVPTEPNKNKSVVSKQI